MCDKSVKCEKPLTMAPWKQLGAGALCTVKLHFLHPKNKVKEVIPNQMASQELSGLIVQSQEFQAIQREQKECVIMKILGDSLCGLFNTMYLLIEGAEDMLFVEAPPAATTVPAADSDGGDGDRMEETTTTMTTKTMNKRYCQILSNHFLYRHAVDDHNAKRHSPISLEVVWATKWWPNRVFAFLLAIMEVNCFLAESYFDKVGRQIAC